jgi:hypothetical protein
MKAFEVIHLLLMAALLFGVPVAAATRAPGEAFSLAQALKQAGMTAGIVLLLMALNFTIARVLSRSGQRKR